MNKTDIVKMKTEKRTPSVSIVVPVYNMERYLEQCLESIRTQTLQDWECIVVDDGSTDRSPAICDEYARKDSRFVVIHKQNGGVSSARNAGLEAFSGEYLGFVDPDDWIEPEMFEHLLKIAKDNDAEISCVGCWKEYVGSSHPKPIVSRLKILDRKASMREMGYERIPNYLCNKLHAKSIVSGKFPEGRVYEDVFIYGEWLKKINRMVVDPILLYHYRMRKGSIIHISQNKSDHFQACLDKMRMVAFAENGVDSLSESIYINKSAINSAKVIARFEKNQNSCRQRINEIRLKLSEYPLPSIRKIGPKKWFRAYLLRNHLNVFIQLMRMVYSLDFGSKHRNSHLYD